MSKQNFHVVSHGTHCMWHTLYYLYGPIRQYYRNAKNEGKTHLSDSHVHVKGAVSGSIKERVSTTLFTLCCVYKVFQT